MADPTITIAGVNRTANLKPGSRISRQLNGRSSADLTIEDLAGGYRPALGNTISIAKDGTVYFAGQISEIRNKVHPGTSAMEIAIRALDYNHILDRRLVSATYENMSLHDIVEDIITNNFAGDGITTTNVEDTSPTTTITEKLVFNYVTGTAALNQLSTITGYQWYVDSAKDLHFSLFAANPAPFALTDTSENWSDLEVSTSLNAYRNRQYVRTEHQIEASSSDTFTCDGVQEVFWSKYPFAAKPTLLVNDILTQIGEAAEPADMWFYDYYYQMDGGGHFVYKIDLAGDKSIIPPDAGTVLEIDYQALFDNLAMVEDTAEQAARAAVEGDSGIWEAIREERNLDSSAALEAVGDGELRRNGSVPTQISFRTDTAGLEPGQQITITNTLHALSDDYLIESVDYEWIASVRGDFFRHSVKCSNKEIFQSTGSGSGIAALASYIGRVAEVSRIGPSSGGTGIVVDIAARFVFDFPASVPIAIESNISINPYRVRLKAGRKIQLDSAVVQTLDAVDGDIVFDLFVSTDGGVTRASIFNSTYPTAENGTKTGTPITDFAVPYLNIDDLVELDVKAIGNNTVVSGALVLSGTVVVI